MNPVFSLDKVSIIPIENRKGHFGKKKRALTQAYAVLLLFLYASPSWKTVIKRFRFLVARHYTCTKIQAIVPIESHAKISKLPPTHWAPPSMVLRNETSDQ